MHTARGTILLVLFTLLAGVLLIPARWSAVVGEVHDEHGPVAGASVRFKGSPEAVWTDAEGRFRLPRRSQAAARVTACKAGYLIAGAAADAPGVAIRLTSLPSQDHEDYSWVDPDPDPARRHNCGNCHEEIHREWSASGHARSVSDRHFLNLYEGSDWHGQPNVGWSLLAEHPDGSGVCTACHAPTVGFDDPAYYDLRKAAGTASRGVHCDYCHKVADVGNRQIGLTHGRFGLELLRPAQGQLFFGPLDDVDRGEDVFAPLYRDSRYCASCHEGTVFGVPVYTTYSEWLTSPARAEGKHCQTCHMAPTGTLDNVAPGKGGIRRNPQTLANHRFFAGSQEEMLRRCLKVDVQLTSSPEGVLAEVEVRADQVGHRVPTGFADRHLLLVVEGFDAAGQPVAARTGPVLPPSTGMRFAGRRGRLYAKQLSDFAGHQPVPFWRAGPEPEDSRLLPERSDRSCYGFPAALCRVEVRLVYRRFWDEVAIQKNWPNDEIVIVRSP